MKTNLYSLLTAACFLLWTPQVVNAQLGALDQTFNSTGYVVNPVNTLDVVQKILVQDDQKVLTIGMSWDANYVARAYAFRYLPDGTPDTEFGTNGVFSYELDFEALLYTATITAEGKILMVGSTTDYQTYRLLLFQLNADGTLDDEFGSGGVVVQSVSIVVDNAEDMAYDAALDAQGNILICGSSYDANYVRRPIIVRFTPAGELDTNFGVDGVASIPVLESGSSSFQGIAVQPDGKIVATGYFGSGLLWWTMLLVRFDDEGTLDPSFGTGGILIYNHGNVDDEGEDLVLMPDGSFLVTGVTVTATYNYSALLVKFTPDGALDMSFGTAGSVTEDLASFDFASNVELLADGKIVIAGSSGVGPPNGFNMAVWKYMPDGTRDSGFGTNGVVQHVIPGYYAMIYAMNVQADGRILIGGQARTTVNENFMFVARLENDLFSGVNDLQTTVGTNVFPNPATAGSMITLHSAEAITADARIDLFAADGRLAGTFGASQLNRNAQGLGFQLPADLKAGIYHMAFQQKGTRLSSTILVTQ